MPPRPAAGSKPVVVVLFDGECNLCNGTVDFLLRRDLRGRFCFAPLQSPVAARLLPGRSTLDSVIVVEQGRVLRQSDAALRLAALLPFPWPLLSVFRAVPRPLRDALYAWIARNRYRWFGRRETCRVASAEERARFLE